MLFPKILVDADALVALANKNDSGYSWARKVSAKLADEEMLVYLSNFAYGEVLTVVAMKLGLSQAVGVAKTIGKGNFIIIDITREQREKSLKKFSEQTSKNIRFTDCVNMILMEELGIKEIFSRDEHYRKNGFIRLGVD